MRPRQCEGFTFRRLVSSALLALLVSGLPAAAQPAAPPYHEEDVTFSNGDVKLAGTLTVPAGAPPLAAVALLTGSGAQNRDEEVFGFRPFRVIADHLGRARIAVLRYDDRGVGGSTGSVLTSTTRDFSRDAMAAHAELVRRFGTIPVGLLGHSEGALAAAMAAAESPGVAFVVLMAGSGEAGDAVLRRQAEDLTRAAGAAEANVAAILAAHRKLTDAVRSGADRAAIVEVMRPLVRAQLEIAPPAQRQGIQDTEALVTKLVEANVAGMVSPWFRAFVSLDPAEALSKVTCPVLALFGERDLQVPPAPNRPLVEAALARAGNTRVTVKTYPAANHLFIRSTTGHPSEYASLEKVFVPELLPDIGNWILAQVKR